MRQQTIRVSAFLSAIFLLASCGSPDTTNIAPPPPPPPGGSVPASFTALAGDGQQAAPGAAVPVKPVFVVKDAAGLGVSGISVAFAVDSGGGSVDAASAVTASDGTASPGNWKLGATEGRNVMHASVPNFAPVKLAASVVTAGTVPPQTIGSGGGTVTGGQAGSPINGMTIAIPAGAFSSSVQVQVSYVSSAAMPHVAQLTVASPIISISTSATGPAAVPFTIHFPVTLGADYVPMVGIVDPTTGFIDALATVSYDQSGVTAIGMVTDQSTVQATPGALTSRASLSSNPRVQYAIFLAKASLLHTINVGSGFLPGVDDWEFPADATPYFSGTEAGEVVAERYYYLMQKSQTQGALSGKFQKAPGAIGSDVGGMQWTSALSKQFFTAATPLARTATTERAANSIAYDRNTIQQIVMSLIASNGRPQIVAFVDPTASTMSPVLAYRWDGPSGVLYDANPDYPGDATRKSTWTSNGLSCSSSCLAVVGVNHLIGYQTQLNAEYPQVTDGTIDKSLFPQAFAPSYDAIIKSSATDGVDTLFMANDTTRIWVECPTCAGQFPTSIPLQHGAAGIQQQRIYYESTPGHWTKYSAPETTTGFFLGISQFPAITANKYADFQIGIEGRGLLTSNTANPTTGWLGWKQYRVIKFDPHLTTPWAYAYVQMTYTLANGGGPALPLDATYQFDWGDGTALTSFSTKPTTVQHTFSTIGTHLVKMKIFHPHNGEYIGTATLSVEAKNPCGG